MQAELMVIHDSFQARYRVPQGALPLGSAVCVRIYTDGSQIENVSLTVTGEDFFAEYPMLTQDGCWWEYTLRITERPGAYWYSFHLYRQGERFSYGCISGRSGGLGQLYGSAQPQGFQITYYHPDFRTPDAYKKAVMYQIFPDRFSRSIKSASWDEGIAYHRKMGRKVYPHGSFDEMPMYLPMPGEEYYAPCDYFGGDLAGIQESLPYLKELGIDVIYLNPVFEADSNHRYNTADYRRIDPILGSEKDFRQLCQAAERMGIRIILDGVFSHTGADSVYFNQKENYPEPGATQGEGSRYYSWYRFREFPTSYDCWWGFPSLPEVNENDPSWREFMISGENSVIRHWLQAGADGYRLDVADELPDDVIAEIRKAIKAHGEDHFLLGEVWEDATTKESYGRRRTYAYGQGLDSVMNYPFRTQVIRFLCEKSSAAELVNFLLGQALNYPPQMYYCLMNLLSSHDVERVRTVLALPGTRLEELSREQQACLQLLPEQDREGAELSRLAAAIQFSVPGMPSIYYGDEVGMNGLKDPFNRAPLREHDPTLIYTYQTLAHIRHSADAMSVGWVSYFNIGEDVLGILRMLKDSKDRFGNAAENGASAYVVLVNRSRETQDFMLDLFRIHSGLEEDCWRAMEDAGYTLGTCLLTGTTEPIHRGLMHVELLPRSAMIFRLT